MYDPYQVMEARAYGADCILIIMAAVEDALRRASSRTRRSALGMDVLVEVHDEAELERALRLKSRLVGINNRDLKTFETTLATCERLGAAGAARPHHRRRERHFAPDDLARLARAGISTFLVGESLMRQNDVAAATRALLARRAALGLGPVDGTVASARRTTLTHLGAARRSPHGRRLGKARDRARRGRRRPRRDAAGDARSRAQRATPRRATCSAPPASPASWRPSERTN